MSKSEVRRIGTQAPTATLSLKCVCCMHRWSVSGDAARSEPACPKCCGPAIVLKISATLSGGVAPSTNNE